MSRPRAARPMTMGVSTAPRWAGGVNVMSTVIRRSRVPGCSRHCAMERSLFGAVHARRAQVRCMTASARPWRMGVAVWVEPDAEWMLVEQNLEWIWNGCSRRARGPRPSIQYYKREPAHVSLVCVDG